MGGREDSAHTSLVGVFEVVLWGYDRAQVNQCIGELEDRLAALYDDQLRADDLESQVRRLREQLAVLRAKLPRVPAAHPASDDVAGILASAEREAAEIRAEAGRELAEARADAIGIVAAARHEATRARRDCDTVLAEYRRKRRTEADELIAAAHKEAARILTEARTEAP